MSQLLRGLHTLFLAFGVDLIKTFHSVRNLPRYFTDCLNLRNQSCVTLRKFPMGKYWPCLADRSVESGSARGHYFHQDLLVARRVFANNPTTHADIGSRVDGFVGHVASFRKIKVLDIRPLSSVIPNIEFIQADLMRPLRKDLIGQCDSLSCLHALEHFGLGRYGDPVSYDGYLTGLDNCVQMLKPGGRFYISVPIGPQRIEFNAHRVFSVDYLLELFQGRLQVQHFSFVDDTGDLHEHVAILPEAIANNFGCLYGCGIFELTKT
jgi:hypothetical protein